MRHPGQLKKLKSWELFWSYQPNSTANPVHLSQNWAKLAVLFSWLLQNGSQDFDFFNCHEGRLFNLCETHCYFCPQILWAFHFSLSQCAYIWTASFLHELMQCVLLPLSEKLLSHICTWMASFPHELMTRVLLKYFCKQNIFHKLYIQFLSSNDVICSLWIISAIFPCYLIKQLK